MEVARLTFQLQAESDFRLPWFYGQTIRGGLSYLMKRLICVTGKATCDGCIVRSKCAYGFIFEPQDVGDRARRFFNLPRLYFLNIDFNNAQKHPNFIKMGDSFSFGISLIDEAISYFPYLIFAISELGSHGLGVQKGLFKIAEVTSIGYGRQQRKRLLYDGNTVVGEPITTAVLEEFENARIRKKDVVEINFKTPMRLDLGSNLVYPIQFPDLLKGIFNRVSTICHICSDANLYEGVQSIMDRYFDSANEIALMRSSQRWIDLPRYSTRQKTEMMMGGVVGESLYQGENLGEFLPLLILGEILQIGKLTTMGLGRYEMGKAGNDRLR